VMMAVSLLSRDLLGRPFRCVLRCSHQRLYLTAARRSSMCSVFLRDGTLSLLLTVVPNSLLSDDALSDEEVAGSAAGTPPSVTLSAPAPCAVTMPSLRRHTSDRANEM
jgi:hypothetical protein